MTFTHRAILEFYIIYEINLRLLSLDSKYILLNSSFDADKLTKNADSDKYSYSGYGIRFGTCGSFSLLDGNRFGKNVIKFGVDKSSSEHADNTKKNILILGKGPTDGLHDTT